MFRPRVSCPEDDVVNVSYIVAILEMYCSALDVGYRRMALDMRITKGIVSEIRMVFSAHDAV